MQPLIYLAGFLVLSNIGVFVKFITDLLKDRQSDMQAKMEKLTDAINKANLSITRLDVQMEHLNKFLRKVDNLEEDMDALHDKLRSLNGRTNSETN